MVAPAQQQSEQRLQDSLGLYRVAEAVLSATGDLTPLMDAAEAVARTMGYDHGAVFLTWGDGEIGWRVGYGSFAGYDAWEPPRTGGALVAEVIAQKRAVVIPSPRASAPVGPDVPVPGARWQACLPLALRGEILGVLVVAKDRPVGDPEDALATATSLSAQLAIGVHNIRLYTQREELAASAERNRLARDIHDGIAQSLYLLTLNLETCLELAERGNNDLAGRLGDSLRLSRNILWETRQYLFDLQPLFSHEGKLAAALEGQVREFRTVSRLNVDVEVVGEEPPLTPEVRAALYRVTQEALANVYKHAQAGQVQVTLTFTPESIQLAVVDDGLGYVHGSGNAEAESPTPGRGLRNMRQRVEELGGTFQVDAAPGGGTRVTATIPIQGLSGAEEHRRASAALPELVEGTPPVPFDRLKEQAQGE